MQQTTAQLQRASAQAVALLVELMNNQSVHAGVRLAAASKILDTAIKAIELDDLEQRLAALEATLGRR